MIDQNLKKLCAKPRARIQSLRPYQPGKPVDELAREFGLNADNIIKLASNENPTGPSKKVIAAIEKEASELTRYPDGNGFDLKQALSKKLTKKSIAVNPENITLGNGSSDILDFIVKCFVGLNEEVIISQHAFAIYGLVTKIQGGQCRVVPAKNYGHDLGAMAAAVTDKTRLIFVTNPNNPTGTWLTQAEITDFMEKIPAEVIVVLDEAYFEYVNEAQYCNGLTLVSNYPNLVVTRTFSKAYGLASLRIGYGVSGPDLADFMNRVRPPFNVNSFALAAAVTALSDEEYVTQSKAVNDAGMEYLTQSFDELGLPYISSVGNFISFEIPENTNTTASAVDEALLSVGVIIRAIANYDMPSYLRISIGTQFENETFIKALTEILLAARS